jgi:hypothetical protein
MYTLYKSNAVLCEQPTNDCDVKEPLCVPRTKQAHFCTIHCAQLSDMAELILVNNQLDTNSVIVRQVSYLPELY